MKLSFGSILLGFVLIVSTSAQAWSFAEKNTNESSIPGSIPGFVCNILDGVGMVIAGSDEQSAQGQEEEEEEEPDCD